MGRCLQSEAVLPRALDTPQENQGSLERSRAQNNASSLAVGDNQPSNNSGDPQGNQRGHTSQIVWERSETISDNFGTPSENVRDVEQSKHPQERSGSLMWMSRSDTAEKPVQENIQGVEYLVKKPNGKMSAAP